MKRDIIKHTTKSTHLSGKQTGMKWKLQRRGLIDWHAAAGRTSKHIGDDDDRSEHRR